VFTRRSLSTTSLRVFIALVCVWGAWSSWKIARGDYLLRQDTVTSVRSSLRLVPDNPAAYMRLAQLDEDHGRQMLETALHLDPYNAQADIELGLLYESEGDPARAQTLLLRAFEIDRTYTPRWSLANFYLRQGNLPAFWQWSRRAAEMPPEDIGALFDLCWRVTPDPKVIADAILNDNPSTVRQFIVFLLTKDQIDAAAELAPRLIRTGKPGADRPLLLAMVNQAILDSDAGAATKTWHALIQSHWIVADDSVPNNRAFSRDPLPVGFDWTLPSETGLHSWPGPAGLAVELSGDEAENCTIAEQTVALEPGNYTFAYTYRTSGIAPDTGITWQILDDKTGAALAVSPSLASDSTQNAEIPFTVSQGVSLIRLHLGYQRALGTTRVNGTLAIQSTSIRKTGAS
jgi:tetratricopeptide (TPR) repeat protein